MLQKYFDAIYDEIWNILYDSSKYFLGIFNGATVENYLPKIS